VSTEGSNVLELHASAGVQKQREKLKFTETDGRSIHHPERQNFWWLAP
jgi:hypothetical protein